MSDRLFHTIHTLFDKNYPKQLCQKCRAEVERLRRIEEAAQSVCYGPFEELDGSHRNLYRALEGSSE